jgi:FG-GAP-like repeat
LAGLLAAIACASAAPVAAADGCPSLDDSYTGTCGPEFAVPSWTDAGGWNDPSQYATIHLADVNGDGKDELIGRSDAGIEIYEFDTTLGQWRPQVDANRVPQLLDDFASFLPAKQTDPDNPNQPQFYSTIQAADVDGKPGAEILARFSDGMRVYKYTPPAGGSSINGGTWTRIGTGGPFSDADGWNEPSRYLTIHTGALNVNSGSDSTDGVVELLGRAAGGWVGYTWSGSGWSPQPNTAGGPQTFYADGNCSTPSCYGVATVSTSSGEFDPSNRQQALVAHTGIGLDFLFRKDGDWTAEGMSAWWEQQAGGLFSDAPGESDCPFPGTSDCFGSSPSYYETLGAANFDGLGGADTYARAADGLRVYSQNYYWGFAQLPTIGALAGAANLDQLLQPGLWGAIRHADINGDGRDELLFLDGKGLEAWSYGIYSGTWSQLQPSTPLALGADPWLTHPEYFSTIQTGDVDGDGHDDVIARGPSGIRTWFYNRRGTGGWERYLPAGYSAFSSQGADNEQNAYTALNKLATPGLIPSGTLRDLWAGENAPQPGDVSNVTNRLPGIANCDAATGSPPQVSSCTPPSGSTGFNAKQWTAVVNEMLTESDAAGQVLAFFADLQTMRDNLFLQESAELPAIGSDLGLQAAAANTAQFNPLSFLSGGLGIAASIAGLVPDIGPALSAALWVVAEATSMVPQTSPTATSSAFPSTYSGLQAKFATMVSETQKGLKVMSQEVRQDASLLDLVSTLRTTGPWATNNLDMTGLQSAASQAFAIWVYQTLMPTVYDRYDITQCAVYGNALCYGPASGTLGVIGGATSTNNEVPFNFTALGPPRDLGGGTPCKNDEQDEVPDCTYTTPPSTLMTSVWGTPSDQCSYVPGQSATAWTFGDCNAGVDPQSSIGDNTWNFTTYSGAFDVSTSHCGWQFGGCGNGIEARAAAQAPGGREPIRLGRPRTGRRRAVRGHAQIQAEMTMPRGLRLAGASVRLNRLLFEPGFRELTAPRARRREQPLALRLSRVGAGRFAAASGGRRWVRVAVRRRSGVRASVTVTTARVYHAPRACHALPARAALKTQPLWLQTRLVISDGRRRAPLEVHHHVRCHRDARGEVDRLEYVPNRRHRLRPGLAITARGPGSVTPGATVRYVAHVHNRRHGRDRLVSSLWDVTLIQGARTKRIHERRRGRTRSVSFALRVPRSAGTARVRGAARGRFCVGIGATAPGAHSDSARVCSRVRALRPPRFTG